LVAPSLSAGSCCRIRVFLKMLETRWRRKIGLKQYCRTSASRHATPRCPLHQPGRLVNVAVIGQLRNSEGPAGTAYVMPNKPIEDCGSGAVVRHQPQFYFLNFKISSAACRVRSVPRAIWQARSRDVCSRLISAATFSELNTRRCPSCSSYQSSGKSWLI